MRSGRIRRTVSLRPLGCSPHWPPRCLTLQLSRSEVAMRLLAKAACADVGAVFVHRRGALRPLAPASALGGCPSTAAQYGVAMSARSYDRCRCGASVLRRDSTTSISARMRFGGCRRSPEVMGGDGDAGRATTEVQDARLGARRLDPTGTGAGNRTSLSPWLIRVAPTSRRNNCCAR